MSLNGNRCPNCLGWGYVMKAINGRGRLTIMQCPDCKGTGKRDEAA